MSNYYVQCRMSPTCNYPSGGCPHADPHPWCLIEEVDTDGEKTCRRIRCTDKHPCPSLGGASTACVPYDWGDKEE